ncbi:sterol desaturase family protein [Flexithrix dorotheae]|uniref:sterol desaturase family protein n=1 Tax=Flexithrix dorotheae TaxID=70993 RepID=UPI000361391E|nr:sterol desaturase family protein [Flexithrix dorotheae]
MGILIIIGTFVFMEFVAWFAHKYIMHGFLWVLHKDHHVKENSEQVLEKNDFFFLIFATPSILLFVSWKYFAMEELFYVAMGIVVYGLAYFFIHEIFIHQRIKLLRNSNNIYFKAIRRAHKIHHKHITKEDGECFGMLFVPLKYFRKTAVQQKK